MLRTGGTGTCGTSVPGLEWGGRVERGVLRLK